MHRHALEAVEPGHQDIHQDDVRLLEGNRIERFPSVARDSHSIAVAAEEADHEVAIGLEVVHDQHIADPIRNGSKLLGDRQRRSKRHGSLIGRLSRQNANNTG